ncbi:cholesterol 7-desaturase nvd-like [Amphiura filiformis]|uniref:cholesterol 7-desaturase nvd-like n=1 Tax=Amphiura filiformis TaxID=82378 RepID=UPI003B224C04
MDPINDKIIMSSFLDTLPIYDILLCILVIAIAISIHRILFRPYQLVRKVGDVGYITDGRNKKEVANEIRKRRRAGDVPPVYPNGWFSVLRSWELKQGEVKYVSALGQELAIFRGTIDNKPFIVDAYCPHLGANIGVGGQVKGDCIQCPFHGWTFNGSDGKCIDIPYSSKVPEFARIRTWRCLEVNGEIMMWFHAEEEEPDWFPPEIEGIKNGTMIYHGYTEHHVNAHIEEIPENGADLAHLHHLHSPFVAAGRDLRFTFSWLWKWVQHDWHGEWSVSPSDKHIGVMTLDHSLTIFGKKFPVLTTLAVEACQIGPGIVHLRLRHPILGDSIMVQTVLPMGPLNQKLVHVMYTTWRIPRPIAKIIMWLEALQVERDLMIWNHKMYQSKPMIVKEESTLVKHRRWYSQFYSENSPRYSTRKETLDW